MAYICTLMKFLLSSSFILTGLALFSQEHSSGHLIPYSPEPLECISAEQRASILAEINANKSELYAQNKLPQPIPSQIAFLNWPLRLRTGLNLYGYHGISAQVDHDPTFPNNLLDYNCGTRTYDTPSGYNHAGTDIFLWPFSWNKMDSLDVEIIAAEAGTIVGKWDGNFDRSCGTNTGNWNAVFVQHADGSVAWYGHMKNGSLTTKINGQTVTQGEYLGVVGSSGNSSGPHLHFELYDAGNNLIDPYSGSCNSLNSVSWWNAQRPYIDKALNHIATNDAPPVFNPCPQQDTKNEQDWFLDTDTIFLMTYQRDMRNGDTMQITIYRPDNSVWSSWPWVNSWGDFGASYVYWWMIAGWGEAHGQWTFEAVYNNQVYFDYFYIGSLGINESAGAILSTGPSPTNDEFSLTFKDQPLENTTIRILGIDGKEILRKKASGLKTTLALGDVQSGIYLWMVEENGLLLSTGKLVRN